MLKPDSVNVASLHAVDAGDDAEQVIVVANFLAAKLERAGRKIVIIFREAILHGARKQGLVARGGDLLIVGQAGRVVVSGVYHAERVRLGGHQFGEFRLAAGKRLGHHHRHVVSRFGDDGADRVFHGDGLAGFKPSLDGACAAEWAEAGNSADNLILPASSRSNSK